VYVGSKTYNMLNLTKIEFGRNSQPLCVWIQETAYWQYI